MKFVVNVMVLTALVMSLFFLFGLVESKPKEVQEFQKIDRINKFTNEDLHVVKVDVTAYTSHGYQTDSTPFIAAWNNRLHPERDKVKAIAVSRDLLQNGLDNGDQVLVVKESGESIRCIVKDKMNRRFKNRIDVYFGLDLNEAKNFGKRNWTIIYQ